MGIILAGFFIGLLYGIICMLSAIIEAWVSAKRTSAQVIFGAISNLIIFIACFWIYMETNSGWLFIELWVSMFIFLNPILLAISSIWRNKDEDENIVVKKNEKGTIEWDEV